MQCNCLQCGQDVVDYRLAFYLDAIREHFAAPVLITSGNRCPEYNARIGGVVDSQHLSGRAADIQVTGVSPKCVADFADELDIPGLGRYPNFTHIDTRSGPKARWGSNA